MHEALVYYKHPSFNPVTPVRVAFEDQPAIDTGRVTRPSSSWLKESCSCLLSSSSGLQPAGVAGGEDSWDFNCPFSST